MEKQKRKSEWKWGRPLNGAKEEENGEEEMDERRKRKMRFNGAKEEENERKEMEEGRKRKRRLNGAKEEENEEEEAKKSKKMPLSIIHHFPSSSDLRLFFGAATFSLFSCGHATL